MPMITRRRQHQSSSPTTTETPTPVTSSNTITTVTPDENSPPNNNDDNDDTVNDDYASNFIKDGSYQDYINAKRARNMEMLKKSGLLEAMEGMRGKNKRSTKTRVDLENERGLKKAKTKDKKVTPPVRRKSSRIAGVKAEDDHFVTGETKGQIRTNINGGTKESNTLTYYDGRINDGSDLSLQDAIELSGTKWVKDDTVAETTKFINELSSSINTNSKEEKRRTVTPTPKDAPSQLIPQINDLDIDDATTSIAKVTPERIYAIASHPSQLLVAAGDKAGHVGLWDVSSSSSHLFKTHTSPVNRLEWDRAGRNLLSISYDGTVREFDVGGEVWRQVFATYDDSEAYRKECGFDCDDGYVQYGCRDKAHETGLFLTTSRGVVLHIDSRRKGLSKFDVSGNKVNSLSQHPVDVNIVATGGLDTTVRLWDLRKASKPLGVQHSSRSVNSAFFSPSGKYLLATTMADTLTLTENAHRQTGAIRPFKSVRHDNQTGRWLSTFMARWHPREDIFVVGSMKQPRRVELFGASGELLRGVEGDAVTSVYSRCCFWDSSERLVVFGGNSSGRVCVLKSDKFCL